MTAYNAYSHHILMEPGGLGNQASLYPILMYTIQHELDLVEKDNEIELKSIRDKGKTTVGLNPSERMNMQGGLNRANLQPARVRPRSVRRR